MCSPSHCLHNHHYCPISLPLIYSKCYPLGSPAASSGFTSYKCLWNAGLSEETTYFVLFCGDFFFLWVCDTQGSSCINRVYCAKKLSNRGEFWFNRQELLHSITRTTLFSLTHHALLWLCLFGLISLHFPASCVLPWLALLSLHTHTHTRILLHWDSSSIWQLQQRLATICKWFQVSPKLWIKNMTNCTSVAKKYLSDYLVIIYKTSDMKSS